MCRAAARPTCSVLDELELVPLERRGLAAMEEGEVGSGRAGLTDELALVEQLLEFCSGDYHADVAAFSPVAELDPHGRGHGRKVAALAVLSGPFQEVW